MPNRTIFSVIATIILCVTPWAFCATRTITARGEKLWDRGGEYLIVAVVEDVVPLNGPNENATHLLTFQPICTLAGEFDPVKEPEIKARAWIDEKHEKYGRSSMDKIPAKGEMVLVLITPVGIGLDVKGSVLWVADEICTFMPDEYGLVPVKDLSDKRIMETVERVRRGRIPLKDVKFPGDPTPAKSGK
ncbi:MAG TPA: hypothetical protein VFE47_22500 [Tepidisphaeraceae bacterium]|jgi:hypothetical protein|nr:hypothetical protein [Tepidisphaeraceae bacterium]